MDAPYSGTALVSEVPKTATYTHHYTQSNGFLTLLSDGQRLTGAYALGPEEAALTGRLPRGQRAAPRGR
jgi:dihydrolipoamide dehydrogenase